MLRLKDRRGKLTPIRSESDRWKQQVNERQDGIENDDRPLSFSAAVGSEWQPCYCGGTSEAANQNLKLFEKLYKNYLTTIYNGDIIKTIKEQRRNKHVSLQRLEH